MARPAKKGLNYFPLDVDIFEDRKIRILTSRYGGNGYALYVYLLCQIYKEGYFVKYDDDFKYIVSHDLGISFEEIGEMTDFLIERSLFDRKLFESDGILTSVSVQRRYQQAIKMRAVKNAVEVNPDYWLLSAEETERFIKIYPDESFSGKNADYSENNPPKVKESKVKESKEKESKVNEKKEKQSKVVVSVPAKNGYFNIDGQELERLRQTYAIDVQKSLKRLAVYMENNANKRRVVDEMGAYVCLWLRDDEEKGRCSKSPQACNAAYDLEEYENMNPFDGNDGDWGT